MFKKVMVIDDTLVDRYIAEKLVKRFAFAGEVMLIEFAQDALDYLSQRAENTGELPDVIFLDIKMPGMDGFGFLEKFEELSETVKNYCKIIMVSSSIDPVDIHRANENKYVIKFVNKPLNLDALESMREEIGKISILIS